MFTPKTYRGIFNSSKRLRYKKGELKHEQHTSKSKTTGN